MSDGTRPWEAVLFDVWSDGQQLSAVGPGPVGDHLAHAQALARQLEPPTRALDLGSGAGIPGLALAGLWPESSWTLVDAAQRRIRLLVDAVQRLGWEDRVEVVHARAEDLGRDPAHREAYDLVVARSFGGPAVTAECASPFVAPGGLMAVTEPPSEVAERWPAGELATLGLAPVGSAGGEPRVQRLRKVEALDPRYPRRAGVPARRPLWKPAGAP